MLPQFKHLWQRRLRITIEPYSAQPGAFSWILNATFVAPGAAVLRHVHPLSERRPSVVLSVVLEPDRGRLDRLGGPFRLGSLEGLGRAGRLYWTDLRVLDAGEPTLA